MFWCVYTHADDANVYKLVMIISLSVVALFLLIFVLFTVQVTLVWIRERRGQYIILFAYLRYCIAVTL